MLLYDKTHDALICQKIHFVGSDNTWNMTDEEESVYTLRLFTSAVAFINVYWKRHYQLPDEQTEVHLGVDFHIQTEQKTAW